MECAPRGKSFLVTFQIITDDRALQKLQGGKTSAVPSFVQFSRKASWIVIPSFRFAMLCCMHEFSSADCLSGYCDKLRFVILTGHVTSPPSVQKGKQRKQNLEKYFSGTLSLILESGATL